MVMKRILLAALLLGVADIQAHAAQAPHREITFHDTLRPGGHQRSLAVANATANSCYASTGTSREYSPTQAFKDCMSAQGFSWMSTRVVGNVPAAKLAPGHFLSPYTGADCHNTGWATICDGGSAFGNWHYQ
jgi:hypothetical protein